MLAAAEITRHAQRLRVSIDHDDRVDAIFVALPAVVLDGLAGTILAGRCHRTFDIRTPNVQEFQGFQGFQEFQRFRSIGVPGSEPGTAFRTMPLEPREPVEPLEPLN